MLDLAQVTEQVSYLISSIRDPQRQGFTLQQLDITHSDRVITIRDNDLIKVAVYLKPTNPACHLVQQIALAIHLKLQENMVDFPLLKLEIKLEPNSHNDIKGVEKQINDKERVVAALQNEEIRKFMHSLINDE